MGDEFPAERFVQTASDFEQLPISHGIGPAALRYGQLIHDDSQKEGAHNTPAAEEGNDLYSHVKGKYGELAFADWLSAHGLSPSHMPFRNDYTRKVDDDDFIVNGVKVEVKAKRRRRSPFPPMLYYNVNMGRRGLEHNLYVFVEIDPHTDIANDPVALLLGWATPSTVKKFGTRVPPGRMSENGRFRFGRYEWDIKIQHLYKAEFLPRALLKDPSQWNASEVFATTPKA